MSKMSYTVAHPPQRPLMVYDGDCHFCRHWILRWNGLTGDRVGYEPFQEALSRFPEIPEKAFRDAVQLILPDGKVYDGAEAVFRALSDIPGRSWMLWCYENIPGVAWGTEWFYGVVARHRVAFSFLTRLLWGGQIAPRSYFVSRALFLKLLGVIYFVAFASLWSQILGLVGSNGILPAAPYLEAIRHYTGPERYWLFPTLCWLHTSDGFLQSLCAGGTFLSLFLLFDIAPALVLFLLWLLYLSLAVVCREFLNFQWDALLLETGFLAIFLAPLHLVPKSSRAAPPSRVMLGLFAWLLFRLMFSSGMVKLASHDPTWRNFTALHYHYETQPLPTWIGWYAHQLPASFQKFSVGVMFGIELGAPFFIFAPRRLRYLACISIIFFQSLIALTGNYCFFNLLTVALSLLLLEDTFWPQRWREKLNQEGAHLPKRYGWPKEIVVPIASIIILMTTLQLTGLCRRRFFWPEPLVALYNLFEPFRSVNSYGLFAVMTTARPELIVEGSSNGTTWFPYEFKYKPGDLKRRPAFVAPHQPRLDWQMWFAALGDYRENPWLLNFCTRLLQGSPDVLRLLSKNPFPDKPPRYVRVLLYDYHFTDFATHRSEGTWWRRTKDRLYCPVLSLQKSVDGPEF